MGTCIITYLANSFQKKGHPYILFFLKQLAGHQMVFMDVAVTCFFSSFQTLLSSSIPIILMPGPFKVMCLQK